MTTVNIEYQGSLRTLATHQLSGNSVTTDAPLDNKGKGAAFSPTDLLASSLASCMATIMGIKADLLGISIDNTSISVTKHMSADSPRRISQIDIDIEIPQQLSDKNLLSMKRVALSCPVAKSIHPDIKVDFTIHCA